MLFHFQKKIHFSQVCLLFCFISGYRKTDTSIFEFISPETRNCEFVFVFSRKTLTRVKLLTHEYAFSGICTSVFVEPKFLFLQPREPRTR
jgi:hypothetical protein